MPSTPIWSIIRGMTIQTDPQYKLRMPPELRDKLKAAAEDNHRSMNAEIIARLQESFGEASGEETDEERALRQARQQYERAQSELHHAMMTYQQRLQRMEEQQRMRSRAKKLSDERRRNKE